LGRGKFFIRSLVYPRFCGISLAVLFEAVEQFSELAAQSDSTVREPATQIAKQAAQVPRRLVVAFDGVALCARQRRAPAPSIEATPAIGAKAKAPSKAAKADRQAAPR
jgi:hypothetical protein